MTSSLWNSRDSDGDRSRNENHPLCIGQPTAAVRRREPAFHEHAAASLTVGITAFAIAVLVGRAWNRWAPASGSDFTEPEAEDLDAPTDITAREAMRTPPHVKPSTFASRPGWPHVYGC